MDVSSQMPSSTSPVYDFRERLAFGERAEAYVAERLGWKKIPGRRADFRTRKGLRAELKTDVRSSTDTGNVFIERFSDEGRRTPGGPWKALRDGSVGFVYFFWGDRKAFGFKTKLLLRRVVSLLQGEGLEERRIQNKGWVTMGYLVPLEKLLDIATVNVL